MQDNSFNLLLNKVEKPARYIGREINVSVKAPSPGDVSVALVFPDIYEIGASYTGYQILYSLINAMPGARAERVFAPWTDMEKLMRGGGHGLRSIESGTPLNKFDIIGFTLQGELGCTNILNLLDLSGIPVLREDRPKDAPIIMAGGPGAYNPVPLSDFIDIFLLGDAEESLPRILNTAAAGKAKGKSYILDALADEPCLYLPGRQKGGPPRDVLPSRLLDLDEAFFPTKQIFPYLTTVHNRGVIELQRGCPQKCSFCHAKFAAGPLRIRKTGTLIRQAEEIIDSAGFEELGLLSLNSCEYPYIAELVDGLLQRFSGRQIALSLPSLRMDRFSIGLIRSIQQVKKTGLTFAPETADEGLRRRIGKNFSNATVYDTVEEVFRQGWNSIKLYFMIGFTDLPYEEESIAEMAYGLSKTAKRISGRNTLSISVSSFVPKAHTPMQWAPMQRLEKLKAKLDFLRHEVKFKNVSLKWQMPEISLMEAVLSTGGKAAGDMILKAWRRGEKFSNWTEIFNYDIWKGCLTEAGIDLEGGLYAEKAFGTVFPWGFIKTGYKEEALYRQYEAFKEPAGPPDRAPEEKGGETPPRPPRPDRAAAPAFRQRVIFRFTKTGPIKYISHLSTLKLFKSIFIKNRLPVEYSYGFNPIPRISLPFPLPLGTEGLFELGEFHTTSILEPSSLKEAFNSNLPEGMRVDVISLSSGENRIFSLLNAADYTAEILCAPGRAEALQENLKTFEASENFIVEIHTKNNIKSMDLKLSVFGLSCEAAPGILQVRFSSFLQGERMMRTSDILRHMLAAGAGELDNCSVIRKNLFYIDRQGAKSGAEDML